MWYASCVVTIQVAAQWWKTSDEAILSHFLRQHYLVQVQWVFLSDNMCRTPASWANDTINKLENPITMCEIVNKLVFDKPVVLMGGAQVSESTLRSNTLKDWPVVAADGGANALFEYGMVPEAIVGDLDSLEQIDYWQQKTQVIHIAEQDSTDFEKCLYTVKAPLIVAVGFTGKRFDHTLVTLHLLQKYADQVKLLLMTGEDVCFAWRGDLQLSLPLGCRFSLYPLSQTTFRNSIGLEYPLDGLTLQQGSLIGTSNRVSDSNIALSAEPEGIYAVIVSKSVLDSLLIRFSDG